MQCSLIIITQKPHRLFKLCLVCTRCTLSGVQYLPCHDDEEIQSVPCVPKVAFLAKNAQGHHLEHHLHGKEDEDEVIKYLQGKKARSKDSMRLGDRTTRLEL